MRVSIYVRLLPLLLAACSSSSNSPGAISGSIKGKAFAVGDSLTLANPMQVAIVLTSEADACVPPAQQVQHPGETALLILLDDYDATNNKHTAPAAAGTYAVSSSMTAHNAMVEANILDAMCENDASNDAVADGGTVQLTSVDNGTFAGTFDVQLDSGDHITGTFQAPTCGEMHNPTPTCQPGG